MRKKERALGRATRYNNKGISRASCCVVLIQIQYTCRGSRESRGGLTSAALVAWGCCVATVTAAALTNAGKRLPKGQVACLPGSRGFALAKQRVSGFLLNWCLQRAGQQRRPGAALPPALSLPLLPSRPPHLHRLLLLLLLLRYISGYCWRGRGRQGAAASRRCCPRRRRRRPARAAAAAPTS